jgi:hypothetical protein
MLPFSYSVLLGLHRHEPYTPRRYVQLTFGWPPLTVTLTYQAHPQILLVSLLELYAGTF